MVYRIRSIGIREGWVRREVESKETSHCQTEQITVIKVETIYTIMANTSLPNCPDTKVDNFFFHQYIQLQDKDFPFDLGLSDHDIGSMICRGPIA